MIPLKKVEDLIQKHKNLEKELSSGNVDKKLFATKSKEYSDLDEIISHAINYLNSCIKNTPKKYKVIAEVTQQIKELLYWKVNDNYKNVYPDHFFQNESFVEIIGPSGLLICPNIRVGFLLLVKDMIYPSHNHEEL